MLTSSISSACIGPLCVMACPSHATDTGSKFGTGTLVRQKQVSHSESLEPEAGHKDTLGTFISVPARGKHGLLERTTLVFSLDLT